MIYIKALLIAACVALAIIFMVQNIQELAEPLRLRLNLFFMQFESTPFATYLVILLAFFVGLFIASLLGMAERFRLRKMMRQSKKEVSTLSKELNSLRNLPITSQSMAREPNNQESQAAENAPAEEIVSGPPAEQKMPDESLLSGSGDDQNETDDADTQLSRQEKEALT